MNSTIMMYHRDAGNGMDGYLDFAVCSININITFLKIIW